MPPNDKARLRRPARLLGSCRRLVFHHIPKTAGTSLHEALVANFPEGKICPERFANLNRFSYPELGKFELFSGHFDKYNIDLIPSPKRVFTFVREPRSRIVSLYKFWRAVDDKLIKDGKPRGPVLAKSLGFLDFLRSEELAIRMSIDNAMARTFLGRNNLLGYSVTRKTPEKFLADWAWANVERYNFVGVVERSEEDFAFLFQLLNLKYQPSGIRRNVGPPASQELTSGEDRPEIEKELDRLTAVDRILYDKIVAYGTRVMSPYPI